MWKNYKYVFYWLYTWQRKLWGDNDLPEYNAILGMSLSFNMIIYLIIILLELTFGIKVPINKVEKPAILFSGFIILLIHYFLFIYKRKYVQIDKELNNENAQERRKKGLLVLLYIFGSIGFYAFFILFGIWLRNNGYTPLIKHIYSWE